MYFNKHKKMVFLNLPVVIVFACEDLYAAFCFQTRSALVKK
jgi:hypothetical protein